MVAQIDELYEQPHELEPHPDDNLVMFISHIGMGFGQDSPGGGISLNIYFNGCDIEPKCSGCHNPSMWEHDDGTRMTFRELRTKLHSLLDSSILNLISSVVFLGGEPLNQPRAVHVINRYCKSLNKMTWLYTGYTYQIVPTNLKKNIDVLICGRYDENQLNPDGFPASLNQVVIRNE